METVLAIVLLVLYLAGAAVSFGLMKEWEHPKPVKCLWSLIWPLTGTLYVIHWIHNSLCE